MNNILAHNYIKNIYISYKEGTPYGLYVLFELYDNFLLFDSSRFTSLNCLGEYELYKWSKINYLDFKSKIYIIEIKEDELVSYFIKFSNEDIFYIYQRVNNLENWEQDFKIANKKDSTSYDQINNYMNEDWIENVIIE